MKTEKVQEILKVFPQLNKAEDFKPDSNEHAIHFIWDEDKLKSYLVLAPFFLNSAYIQEVNMVGKLRYPYSKPEVLLLLNTPTYDGKGFGIWAYIHRRNNLNWFNLNSNSSEEHLEHVRKKAQIFKEYFIKLQREFELFKTILLLYGIEIYVDPEREE